MSGMLGVWSYTREYTMIEPKKPEGVFVWVDIALLVLALIWMFTASVCTVVSWFAPSVTVAPFTVKEYGIYGLLLYAIMSRK